MQLENFFYFRKNYLNLNNNIKFQTNLELKPFKKKILIAEKAFNEFTYFEKWVQQKGYRYHFNKSYLMYAEDHWLYGKKGFFSKKINFRKKDLFKHYFTLNGKEAIKFYGLPKSFKFFGGYTY